MISFEGHYFNESDLIKTFLLFLIKKSNFYESTNICCIHDNWFFWFMTIKVVLTWHYLFDLQRNCFIPSLKKYEQQKLVHDDLSSEIQLHIYKQKKHKKKWMVFKAALQCFLWSALFYVGKIVRRKIRWKELTISYCKKFPLHETNAFTIE